MRKIWICADSHRATHKPRLAAIRKALVTPLMLSSFSQQVVLIPKTEKIVVSLLTERDVCLCWHDPNPDSENTLQKLHEQWGDRSHLFFYICLKPTFWCSFFWHVKWLLSAKLHLKAWVFYRHHRNLHYFHSCIPKGGPNYAGSTCRTKECGAY